MIKLMRGRSGCYKDSEESMLIWGRCELPVLPPPIFVKLEDAMGWAGWHRFEDLGAALGDDRLDDQNGSSRSSEDPFRGGVDEWVLRTGEGSRAKKRCGRWYFKT